MQFSLLKRRRERNNCFLEREKTEKTAAAMASRLPPPQNPTKEEGGDSPLKTSSFLSREEVLRRRARRAKAQFRCYRARYWAFVEEIRAKHREYYWNYGLSPLERDNRGDGEGNNEGFGEEVANGQGKEEGKIRVRSKCGFGGCKSRAMPLTRFCHLHILADAKQTLYKGCIFITKSSGQNGPCGKPILRATVPSLCPAHFQKAQKNLTQSLKKVGINLCTSSRPTAEFNAILVEYIHKIQAQRKKALTKRSKILNSTAENMRDERKIVG